MVECPAVQQVRTSEEIMRVEIERSLCLRNLREIGVRVPAYPV